jgi:hypothetical protein
MAKKINTEDIDEDFILASIKKDKSSSAPVNPQVSLTPQPANAETGSAAAEETNIVIPPAGEAVKESAAESRNEEARRRRGSRQDYESLFLRNSKQTARLGKITYIRAEFHNRIQKIIRVIGEDEISLTEYVDNVLSHHFETYRDDIARLYDQRHKGIF